MWQHVSVSVVLSGGFLLCFLLALLLLGSVTGARVPLATPVMAAGIAWAVAAVVPIRLRRRNHVAQEEPCWRCRALMGFVWQLTYPAESDDALSASAETVARSLGLRHAAVELYGPGNDVEVISTWGSPGDRTLRLCLPYAGKTLGSLVVSLDSDDDSTRTLALLESLASALAMAAQALVASRTLRRSRDDLMLARSDERRKLRRDLHDGLGPVLATVIMRIDAVRSWLTSDPAEADALLGRLRADAESAATDVRRIIHELRSPSPGDGDGLMCALHAHASRVQHASGGRLRVRVDGPRSSQQVPAAVAFAVERIASEALTNVVKHANARLCVIRVAMCERLYLEITDDGVGLPRHLCEGIGLESMRERAHEMGGDCRTECLSPRGTRVVACLPLPGQSPAISGGNDANADSR